MKLAEVLVVWILIGILAGLVAPAVGRAKRFIVRKAAVIHIMHDGRIDFLASGAIEDPEAHGMSAREAERNLQHFTSLEF
jgi:hypothetical protein